MFRWIPLCQAQDKNFWSCSKTKTRYLVDLEVSVEALYQLNFQLGLESREVFFFFLLIKESLWGYSNAAIVGSREEGVLWFPYDVASFFVHLLIMLLWSPFQPSGPNRLSPPVPGVWRSEDSFGACREGRLGLISSEIYRPIVSVTKACLQPRGQRARAGDHMN